MQFLHQWFEFHAELNPDAVALVFEDESLTYSELNRYANAWAHRLRERGVGPDCKVALGFDRGPDLIVALLAVLKAGGAYLPLDPAYPAERLAFMLADCHATVVLAQREVADRLRAPAPSLLLFDRAAHESLDGSSDLGNPSASDLRPEHLAYVIYTSGSTGRPKGVLNRHAGLINLVPQLAEQFQVDATSRVLQFASPSFDASVLEVAMALCLGATLCLARRESMLPGNPLLATLLRHRITHLTLPPSALSVMPPGAQMETVKTLTVAGEAVSAALVRRWAGRHRMINIYGPTETTIYVTSHHCEPGQQGSTPIGRPVRNVSIHILDDQSRRVIEGEVGEIFVGGPAVSRGYLVRPELTAVRFLTDPFSGDPRALLYKTGDLGRRLPGGSIEYLGRTDHQIKLRGYRIELGEIEAKLSEIEGVREAVVLASEDTPGDKRLVAYFTASYPPDAGGVSAGAPPRAEVLRQRLASQLPEYMVPAAFVALAVMPLTANGKIDRHALPAPQAHDFASRDYVAPQGEIETSLASIWSEVLGLQRIGRNDNFFELGGHSLLAVRVASRVQQRLGVELDLGEMFNKPELGALAEVVQYAAQSALPQITPIGREQPLALSFAQQRLWFLAQMEGVSEAYHIPLQLRLVGALDRSALQRALRRIVARHEALRTTFVAVDGEPTQHVAAPGIELTLKDHDLREFASAQLEMRRLIEVETTNGFDLATGPLIRGRLVQLGESEHALLLTMHHIVSDGWSMTVLSNELATLYSAFSEGKDDPLPALPIQYADFAAWQRRWLSGAILQSQREYWRRTLMGAPALIELPADRARPQRQDHAGGVIDFEFDESLSAGLRALGRRHGATLFMTLLAAWGAVLARLSGQAEVVIGTPVANRRRIELEGLIGFFVNTLALRLDSTGSPSVVQWLERVKAQVVGAQQNQDLPFEQVVELMRPVRSLAHSPLFQVMFVWEGQDAARLGLAGVEVEALGLPTTMAKFDLTLTLREQGLCIGGTLGYATALFDTSTIQRHVHYLTTVATAMVADHAKSIDVLQVLPEAEHQQLLVGWNDTKVAHADLRCVHEQFEWQAAKHPLALAVQQGDRRVSYGELNGQANQLTHRLRALGVGAEVRVVILAERGLAFVMAIVATLKAGGAYVPLDPAYPVQRLADMILDSAPQVVLAQKGLWDGVRNALGPKCSDDLIFLDLGEAHPDWANESESNPSPAPADQRPERLAYVIYTSGSTGRPKGVMVEHRQLRNYVSAIAEVIDLPHGASYAAVSTFAADLGHTAIFPSLCGGGALHVIDREVAMNGPLLAEYMEREGIDLLKIVPSHLDALLQTTEHPVRLIPAKRLILGGEPCSWGLIDRVRSMSPECVVINHYGPTETTVGVSTLRLTEMSQRLSEVPPIGRPLANVSLHVLDERLALMPIGTPGELYVGGSQVARGYLNNESDTAARFIRSPFGEGRLYRTGDRARVLSNGTLQLLARTDHQIKLRGYRIELGEIEAKLSEIEGVREAVVLAREDTPGDKRLVAYFTATYAPDAGGVSAGTVPSAEILRQRLASQLPEYMVPAAFVAMQALPLTPNGKIDRKALPEPDARAYASKAYEAPAGEAESALASIWSEVLGIERIGRRDNFFALGGHSLMAVRVASRVQRRLGIELELGEFFDKPELMALAAVLQSAARSDLPAIERVPREQLLALSFAQQRLWFLAQIEGVSQAYHIGMGMRLVGRLDPSALRRALERIVQRHEALRTTFMARDGKPTQHIARPDIGFALQHHDLREHAGAAQELQRLSEQEARTGFDLQTGPLIRGRLVQTGGSEHVLILSMHHIVSDGWSRGVLSAELSALYSAFCQGQDDPLPALPIQYADFAAWQRRWLSGAVLHTQSQYWQRTLLGAPELIELPTDRPRPPRQDHAGAAIEFEFDDALSAQLKALGQRHGATLFMTLLAAWGAVLVRLSGQIEVVIGTPVANRRRSELEPMIGFFVNTLALRLDSTGSPSVAQWLERVRAQALGAQQHQDLPFEQVVELMRPVRSLKHSPLFQVMFAWEGQQPPAPELPGLQLQPVQLENNVAKFDLTLTLREQGGRIGGELGYASALFDKSSIERHVEYLRCIAGSMVADQAQPIDRLQILPEAERHKLLVQWNDTKVDDPEPRCVHELFEAKAARAPDAVALRQGERQLSYGELNARANQLAHHLRAMGLKPDDRVAVVVQRSVEMVVALLATLKAGGAYVPLDPTYPAQRLAYMLDDSAPQLILTQGGVWAGVQQRWGAADAACAGNTPVLDLDSPTPLWAAESTHNPGPHAAGQAPQQLAYVMYTSGSTGEPKGVATPHRAITRLVLNNGFAQFAASDRVALAANPAFDASTLEVWAALLNGGCVVVIEEETLLDPARFAQTLLNHSVNVLWLTVGLFNQYAAELVGVLPTLRYLMVGGDVIDPRVIARVMRGARPQHVLNGYGPTESTTFATTFEIGAVVDENASIPIGRPIANTRIYIVDRCGEPVPMGARGEVYIGGTGLALGYLNRPELTAERFVPDPYSDEPGARLYKTGDLARYLPDGNIEFLGRNDFQVKIRGFRIELAEIEARLSACPGVREAVVVAREDTPGEKRLVAYYSTARSSPSNNGSAPIAAAQIADSQGLRDQLAAQLPDHMLPVAFVELRALPLTANGKVDRRALPAPQVQAFAIQEHEAPVGPIETTLAQIWCEVLGLEQVGRYGNFFDLGGHSLKATQVVSRVLRDLGVALSVRAIFESPNLHRLAAHLRLELNNGVGSVTAQSTPQRLPNHDALLPTSFSQRRMWLVQRLNPATTAYNISLALRLSGALDEDAFMRSLDLIARRHAAFRTRFEDIDGEPMQRIVPRPSVGIERLDLRDRAPLERHALARRMVGERVAQPFDLSVAGLHRITLLRLGADEHVLLWAMHHAIGDHWSFGVLLHELRLAYAALAAGQAPKLATPELEYADYAAWQRERAGTPEAARQLGYWRQRLEGVTALRLPADFSRGHAHQGEGGAVDALLDPAVVAKLRQFSVGRGATPYMTLLACFQMLMARFSGQTDIATAAPIANRLGVFSESLVGTLVNTLVMRTDLSGNPRFTELLAQVQETALQAYANQDVPFEQVVEALDAPRDALRAPLVQVLFNLVNAPFSVKDFAGLKVKRFEFDRRAAQFELAIGVDLDVFQQIQLGYASTLFAKATAQRLLESYMSLIESVLEDPNRRVDEYDLLTDAQRADLESRNRTDAPKPAFQSVAEMISACAAWAADRPALRDLRGTLSHAQLEAQSNRLARELRRRGVRRGALVGLCVERTSSMVVAQLAILKSGAAYVPLDPVYPPDRLAMMADDAQLALLVTQSRNAGAVKWPRDKSLWLDADAAAIDAHSDAPLAPDAEADADPTDPAYVLYTSGSTGKPKGVPVPHGAVLNFLASMAREPGLTAGDRVLAVTTLSFDIAVLELLLPLTVGAMIILATTEQAQDGRALRELLDEQNPTLMQATPSTWRMLIEAGWTGRADFKALIGGEGLPLDLAEQLLARASELWNMYGPTETTVWSTCWRVVRPAAGISIGRPIANTQVHVLDGSGRQCQIGVPGEIYIGGDGVALGYLNRPELTAERFVADPFRQLPGARMYRTGDLGRWRHDGQLEHMGRLDHQVKVRGHRIELGEIEANLGSFAGVARVVVIAREDRPGDARIVAYIVPRRAMPAAAKLRDHVRAMLPHYMVPQHFVRIEAVPLLPNGKLDRSKLQKPSEAVEEAKSAVHGSFETDLERGIAEIWQRLLNIDVVGRADNFFDLGGHSLLAMRAVSDIESTLGVNISPRRLIFESLAQLAAAPGQSTTAQATKAAPAAKGWLGGLKRLFGAKAP